LSGTEARTIELESSTSTQTSFDPFDVSPVGVTDIITRTQPLLDLDDNTEIAVESDEVESTQIQGYTLGEEDSLQIQLQTNP
jgi:hypothetical protein